MLEPTPLNIKTANLNLLRPLSLTSMIKTLKFYSIKILQTNILESDILPVACSGTSCDLSFGVGVTSHKHIIENPPLTPVRVPVVVEDVRSLVVALRRFFTAFISDAYLVQLYVAGPGSIQCYCHRPIGDLHPVHILDSPADHRLLVV